MIAFHLIFIGLVAMIVTAPDTLLILLDVLDWHIPSSPGLIDASRCAQQLAAARAGL